MSSAIEMSAKASKTGASFTGVTVSSKVSESDNNPSLTNTVISEVP